MMSSPTFNQRYKNLLDSEKYSDCTFHVGNSIINCHKLILSTASSVFEAMLYGPMKEQKPIEIVDISADIFYILMEYIYTGEISTEHTSIESYIELYYCAEKYLLDDLSHYCLDEIKSKLRFENVLAALDLSTFMNLKGLEKLCTTFFMDFCLHNFQFMALFKSNYYHISMDSMKSIIEAANENYKILFWFIFEWCKNEYENRELTHTECNTLVKKLNFQLNDFKDEYNQEFMDPDRVINATTSLVERTYYKASRPFVVSADCNEAYILVRPNRFIAIHGLVMSSRLMPAPSSNDRICRYVFSNEYKESLVVQIQDAMNDNLIYEHKVDNQCTRYNCDLILLWNDMVSFDPRRTYRITLKWKRNAYGAEYPASLQSNLVDGISFQDMSEHLGGIIKGLKISL